ncbi:MAG: LacI family DNA-binding transcriptional regulator [Bauldia sp.]|nr:LacI family DNA-binding transcriptional regulator [Bauldia sp.]
MGRVTIHQLAKEAGVSLATVDRVLNGRAGVRPATVQRVESAIDRLDYRRDLAATNLARKRTYPITFVVPDGPGTFMRGLEAEVRSIAQHPDSSRVHVDMKVVPAFDGAKLVEALGAVDPADTMGVVVVATDAPLVRAAINDLADRGIHVVTLVSDVPTSRRLHFAGIDNTAAGRTAGTLLGRFIRKPGRVAIVAGSLLLRDHVERRMGFEQVLRASFPDLDILPPVEGRDEAGPTAAALAGLLERHPDIVGVYSLGAGTRGVIEALERSGRANEIVAIAHELTPASRKALMSGTLDALINQDAGHEVRSAIRVIQAKADGRPLVPGQERIRIDVYFRENLP